MYSIRSWQLCHRFSSTSHWMFSLAIHRGKCASLYGVYPKRLVEPVFHSVHQETTQTGLRKRQRDTESGLVCIVSSDNYWLCGRREISFSLFCSFFFPVAILFIVSKTSLSPCYSIFFYWTFQITEFNKKFLTFIFTRSHCVSINWNNNHLNKRNKKRNLKK